MRKKSFQTRKHLINDRRNYQKAATPMTRARNKNEKKKKRRNPRRRKKAYTRQPTIKYVADISKLLCCCCCMKSAPTLPVFIIFSSHAGVCCVGSLATLRVRISGLTIEPFIVAVLFFVCCLAI